MGSSGGRNELTYGVVVGEGGSGWQKGASMARSQL